MTLFGEDIAAHHDKHRDARLFPAPVVLAEIFGLWTFRCAELAARRWVFERRKALPGAEKLRPWLDEDTLTAATYDWNVTVHMVKSAQNSIIETHTHSGQRMGSPELVENNIYCFWASVAVSMMYQTLLEERGDFDAFFLSAVSYVSEAFGEMHFRAPTLDVWRLHSLYDEWLDELDAQWGAGKHTDPTKEVKLIVLADGVLQNGPKTCYEIAGPETLSTQAPIARTQSVVSKEKTQEIDRDLGIWVSAKGGTTTLSLCCTCVALGLFDDEDARKDPQHFYNRCNFRQPTAARRSSATPNETSSSRQLDQGCVEYFAPSPRILMAIAKYVGVIKTDSAGVTADPQPHTAAADSGKKKRRKKKKNRHSRRQDGDGPIVECTLQRQ